MKTPRTAFLLALLLAGPVFASGTPPFHYSKDLARGAGAAAGEEILSFTLDGDIYAAVREGFPDLRILDRQDGAEVPYALERVEERRPRLERRICESETSSLREVDGEGLEIIVRLADDAPYAGGLTIVSPQTDYEHRVRVFGSPDGKVWSPLVSDGLIFDFSRHMELANRDVALPANTHRRFKLVVEQAQDRRESPFQELTRTRRGDVEVRRDETTVIERRPFRIDRIEMWRMVEVEGTRRPVKARYPIAAFEVEDDPKARVTRIRVRSRREPLTGLILHAGTRNFSRSASVRVPQTSGGEDRWVEVGSGTIDRFDLQGFRREDLRIDFPERREDRYEIVIENGDSPPLEITGVEAEGNVYRLVFLGSPGRSYRVAYGSDAAKPPLYDTAAVLSSLRTGYRPAPLIPGAEVEDPRYRPLPVSRNLLGRPVVLIVALVLMVAVLAWLLLRAGKEIEKLPVDEV